jgi:putative membrane protein
MGDIYMTFKALHLIFMVTWFAGLFYLFRLFVYHIENQDKPDVVATLIVMERKLYKIITVPGMVLTFVFGLLMIGLNSSLMQQPWLHAKLTLVILLAGYTGYVGATRRKFERGDIKLSSRAARWINEIPTLFLILIVFVAVFRYKMM